MTTGNANLFGLSCIGDGSRIKRMPLLNNLAMCSSKSPAVIAILDCTDYMVVGGNKMLNSSCPFSNQKVDEFDPGKTLTDTFFFDGAANVQKAGHILCAHFPQTVCFHGGEHVLSIKNWFNKGVCNLNFNL